MKKYLLLFFAFAMILGTTPIASANESCLTSLTNQPTARRGSQNGQHVRMLQTIMNTSFAEKLATDGIFGRGTRAAVIRTQKKLGLYPDGVVGKKTYAAFKKYCINENNDQTSNTQTFTHAVKNINTQSELDAFIKKNVQTQYVKRGFAGSVMAMAVEESISSDVAVNASVKKTNDYSQTNVQEIGVDEADIIKTDGSYVYAVSGGEVVVVDVRNASDLSVVARVKYNGNPQELYFDGKTLIVIGRDYDTIQKKQSNDIASTRIWYPQQTSFTSVVFYDVRKADKPKKIKSYDIEGNYVDSRLTDGQVYIINDKYMYDSVIPFLKRDGQTISQKINIDYFDMPYSNTRLTQIHGIDVDNPSDIESSHYLLSGNQNMYVSENNIYISYQDYGNPRIIPFVENDVDVVVADDTEDENKETTIIHRVEINNGESELVASGTIPGRVLNQFSMSEYKNYLRVATTAGNNWNGEQSQNNMYVLDMDMDIVGRLEGLAAGERIYSARFMGDTGYMVTFEQVDPLFVVDLSDPRRPRVQGELKIPGFSNYLHPYDDTTLLGIGRDVEVDEKGRITTRGVKIALFDVLNVNKPREIDSYIIGDRGSSSQALYNHKAVLFSKEKNLLVIPFNEYSDGERFNGSAVFSVDKKSGIELQGKVSHMNSDEKNYWRKNIERNIYIGDVLYSLSQRLLQSNDLGTLKKLDQVTLSQSEKDIDYPIGIPEPVLF